MIVDIWLEEFRGDERNRKEEKRKREKKKKVNLDFIV